MSSWLSTWRFLVSRRWLLFFLAVLLLGYGTWWLGEWQFARLEDRKDRNAVVLANEQREAAPVAGVLSEGGAVSKSDEWRLVTATGEYAVDDTVVVRYRVRSNRPGVEVVVPLVTEDGTALIVDRGWFATDDPQIGHEELPAPPAGQVTVQGWVRADGSGSSTEVSGRSTRAISSDQIGKAIDRAVYGGFIVLKSEDPAPAQPLEPVEMPELDEGPHFFYGLQWWFFGVLAALGFGYLAWDERRNGRRGERRDAKPRSPGPFSSKAQRARVSGPTDKP